MTHPDWSEPPPPPRRVNRTELQIEADKLDCDLYRVISGVAYLVERNPRDKRLVAELQTVARSLRAARSPLRSLMHQVDRDRTRGW